MHTFESPCISHHYTAVCLTTGQYPLPMQVLHRVSSSASSFNFKYPLSSVRSSSSCLRLLPRLPITFISPSITCFTLQFLRNMWSIQLAFLPFTVCKISYFLDSLRYVFISHTISPNYLLQFSPAPHFTTSRVFPIYFRSVQVSAPYIQRYALVQHFTTFFFNRLKPNGHMMHQQV
jgi:hypothetical protein